MECCTPGVQEAGLRRSRGCGSNSRCCTSCCATTSKLSILLHDQLRSLGEDRAVQHAEQSLLQALRGHSCGGHSFLLNDRGDSSHNFIHERGIVEAALQCNILELLEASKDHRVGGDARGADGIAGCGVATLDVRQQLCENGVAASEQRGVKQRML